ncbi:hypothetical protein [uncultured Aquitalea sp.]|uniref:hypothetical protein n=1 Tax=uncultured Aquitalea sp. TaxID=540272 RepID=UPI0025F5F6FC|nr:hypothetical protein [uncultured Aquitalea sp.]
MAQYHPISRYLPVTFPNGNRVRRFGKHCPACRKMVGCENMFGIATLEQDKLFLAAQAHCPACGHRFPVACVINDNKHVNRVALPMWLFRFWLKMITRNRPLPPQVESWELSDAEAAAAPSGAIVEKMSDVVCSEDVLGRFDNQPICAWVEYQGRRFEFERTAPPGGKWQLNANELLLEGRLIYRLPSVETTA